MMENWLASPDLVKVVSALIGIAVIFILVKLINRGLTRYISDGSTRYHARKLVTFVGYFAVILLVSLVFRTRLGGLTVFLGFIGVGIAFSLQEVIASIAGWLAISFGGFYNVGDRVQLGNIKGDVIDISILRTTLMEIGEWVQADLYTGRIVRVANSSVFKAPVYNFSGDFPYIWDELHIPVKFGGDVERARIILEQIADEVVGEYIAKAQEAWGDVARKYRVENAVIKPIVTLSANDNWIDFTLRYIVDYKTRRRTQDRIFTRMLEEFDKTEGKVAISSATVQIVELPDLRVRLNGEAR